jgi:uncharacterized membrane protein YoaK (UPF0700 family)
MADWRASAHLMPLPTVPGVRNAVPYHLVHRSKDLAATERSEAAIGAEGGSETTTSGPVGAGRAWWATAALSVCTGALDALAFVRLGNVFASVMTGNMVLLGVSVGRRDAALAVHAGVALAGYVAGAALVAWLCRPGSRATVDGRVVAVSVEVCVLGVLAVVWQSVSSPSLGTSGDVLLVLAAFAMGDQSALVRRVAALDTPTTYLTGTLTEVVSRLVTERRPSALRRPLLALGGLVVGAAAEVALLVALPGAGPFLPFAAAIVAAVLLGAPRPSMLTAPAGE